MADQQAPKTIEEAMDEAMARGADTLRALSLGDDPTGGYLIPKQLDGSKRKPKIAPEK